MLLTEGLLLLLGMDANLPLCIEYVVAQLLHERLQGPHTLARLRHGLCLDTLHHHPALVVMRLIRHLTSTHAAISPECIQPTLYG